MNWTEKAHKDDAYRKRCDMGLEHIQPFNAGIEWMLEQLRTDEAVERLANFLHDDAHGETLDHHDTVCERDRGGCDRRETYMNHACAAIAALIGEKS